MRHYTVSASAVLSHGILVVATCVIVLSTTFMRVSVATRADLANVMCGLPIPFAEFSHSDLDPPSYPRTITRNQTAWGNFPTVDWGYFLIDVGLVYGLLLLSWWILRKLISSKLRVAKRYFPSCGV